MFVCLSVFQSACLSKGARSKVSKPKTYNVIMNVFLSVRPPDHVRIKKGGGGGGGGGPDRSETSHSL